MKLTVGSICAGIGGWDLGLERAGMVTRWQVELDPWCRRVLARHFPHAERYEDAHAVDYTEVGYVDVIAAGYPCQPFSVAGLRRGSDDPRNVWPAVARAVRDIRPRFVLLENVAAHLSLGFSDVLGDLATLGYDARWEVLPAAAFGAPHLRERVWVIATWPAASNTSGQRCEELDAATEPGHMGHPAGAPDSHWSSGPSQPWVRRVDDGVPRGLDRRRLRALGNALVPQIAEYIGRQVVRMSEAAA